MSFVGVNNFIVFISACWGLVLLKGLVFTKTDTWEHFCFSFLNFSAALTAKLLTIGLKVSKLETLSPKLLLTIICFFDPILFSIVRHLSPLNSLTVLSKTILNFVLIFWGLIFVKSNAVLIPADVRCSFNLFPTPHILCTGVFLRAFLISLSFDDLNDF